ncbi:MAG: hypothetical protein RLZZ596_2654 [Pseudomonadota bacterium]|jgi:hypothetical protein
MHVHWLSPYQLTHTEQVAKLNIASVRLRTGALLAALEASDISLSVGDVVAEVASVCFVGKLSADNALARGATWVAHMKRLQNLGKPIVLDYTDDHLAFTSPMSAFYREAVGLVDVCVCSSKFLAKSLSRFYSGRIEVIPDAIEVAPLVPKQSAHSPITLLWFGHATNVDYLVRFLPLLARQQALKLLILTNEVGIKHLQSIPLQLPSNLTVEGGVWSVENMIHAASLCDLCIIPSDLADPRKAGVSSNRLLTALALSLPTAADRLDSYLEHSDFFTDIRSKDFDRLLDNPLAFRDQVIKAQNGPVQEHTMQKIGQRWIRLLESI